MLFILHPYVLSLEMSPNLQPQRSSWPTLLIALNVSLSSSGHSVFVFPFSLFLHPSPPSHPTFICWLLIMHIRRVCELKSPCLILPYSFFFFLECHVIIIWGSREGERRNEPVIREQPFEQKKQQERCLFLASWKNSLPWSSTRFLPQAFPTVLWSSCCPLSAPLFEALVLGDKLSQWLCQAFTLPLPALEWFTTPVSKIFLIEKHLPGLPPFFDSATFLSKPECEIGEKWRVLFTLP